MKALDSDLIKALHSFEVDFVVLAFIIVLQGVHVLSTCIKKYGLLHYKSIKKVL